MIELYAVADHPGPPLPKGTPVRAVPTGKLAVLCGPVSDDQPSAPRALWRHEEVVEALMEDRDLLPVRYGTRLPDEAAAASAIAERSDELAAALDRVRGAVELSVRVVEADASESGQTVAVQSGADYLRARARAEESREVSTTLHEPLVGLARASVRRPPREPSELLRAAYLVDRTKVERFTKLVAHVDEANPELSLLCTGPWPPYSFVER